MLQVTVWFEPDLCDSLHMGDIDSELTRQLPTIMGEGFIGFGHLVSVILLLDRGPAVL